MKQMPLAGLKMDNSRQPNPEMDQSKSTANSQNEGVDQNKAGFVANLKSKAGKMIAHVLEIFIAHGVYEAAKHIIADYLTPLLVAAGLAIVEYSYSSFIDYLS
jgi:hypothetical protein